MAQTIVQTGVQYMRNNRCPLDGETVQSTYSDLQENLTMTGAATTEKGFMYGGMMVAVINDSYTAYNGPYYISYTNVNNQISYQATRLRLKSESDEELYMLLHQPEYTSPSMSVQFLSPITHELTTVSNKTTVYEDVEIGTIFTPGIQINWPERTSTQIGTRAASAQQDPTKIDNYLLGYSYGVQQNGITFDLLGNRTTTYELASIHKYNSITVNSTNPITVFDKINVKYLHSSYMFYQQLYDGGRFEYAYGKGSTSWSLGGTYEMPTQRYIITGKYRYYWGLSDAVPSSKEELVAWGNSGLLNSTDIELGTTTSHIVGDKGKNCKHFWVAFPSMYALSPYNSDIRVCCHQPDGVEFDLVSPDQNMKCKKLMVSCGNESMVDEYNVAFFDFEWPIGNPNSIISFTVIPAEAVHIIYTMTAEDGEAVSNEAGTMTLRTESSNNMIYDDTIFA